MFSLDQAIKKLIVDAIVEAYDRIKDGEATVAESDGKPEEIKEDPAPGEKRKRRTKAEMEADSAKPEPKAIEIPVAKKEPYITYDELKQEIFNYIAEYGSANVVSMLSKQFGVKKAQDLREEQWAECYVLVQNLPREQAIA